MDSKEGERKRKKHMGREWGLRLGKEKDVKSKPLEAYIVTRNEGGRRRESKKKEEVDRGKKRNKVQRRTT